ncbi:MAG: class I SAM-dependent methyltransferase [Hyphomicrobium sp.]
MSGFSSEWLSLREGADRRARNPDVANAVSAWFTLRKEVSVVDLGCGTGANLRATAPILPDLQSWRLVDGDGELLAAARNALRSWADACTETDDGGLALRKGHAEIAVTFEQRDLSGSLEGLFAKKTDLVTASAFFDLASPAFIKALVRAVAEQRAAFYAVLTYNGLQRWAPHRPADSQMAAAFNRHQMTDKGFGAAAGPAAAGLIADQLRLEDYTVLEGESPWTLGQNDRTLIAELQRGHAIAVLELGAANAKAAPDARTVETWVKTIRSAAQIGHTDTFAMPA